MYMSLRFQIASHSLLAHGSLAHSSLLPAMPRQWPAARYLEVALHYQEQYRAGVFFAPGKDTKTAIDTKTALISGHSGWPPRPQLAAKADESSKDTKTALISGPSGWPPRPQLAEGARTVL